MLARKYIFGDLIDTSQAHFVAIFDCVCVAEDYSFVEMVDDHFQTIFRHEKLIVCAVKLVSQVYDIEYDNVLNQKLADSQL